ncbi:MAG: hypothetical protein PHU44_06020 [Syntrophales bacterium]|nr:hypothetical protein [Syntrophales bacterium]MDD5640370.1 hypothetical protein [Syntrophales bacterium]
MPGRLEVILGGKKPEDQDHDVFSFEEDFTSYQQVIDNLLRDAQNTWAEIWHELMGTVTNGTIILSDANKGAKPKCGWAEFLEKLWLLKHYLDYTRRFAAKDV